MLLLATVHTVGAAEPQGSALLSSRAAINAAVAESKARQQARLLTRSELLAEPTIVDVQLAPDGRHLLFRQRSEQRHEWRVRSLDGGDEFLIYADAEGSTARWSGDGQRIWLADELGLAIHELGTRSGRRVLKWDLTRDQRFWAVDSHAPLHALIREIVPNGARRTFRYLSVDTDGKLTMLIQAHWALRDALLDAHGALRFSAAYDGASHDTVIRRHDPQGSTELSRCQGIEQCRLVDFDDDALFLLSQQGDDLLSLRRLRFGDAAWDTLHRDPHGVADLSQLLWSTRQRNWLAAAYPSTPVRWYGRDSKIERQLQTLQGQLDGASLELSAQADGLLWLVKAQRADWARSRHLLYWPETARLREVVADTNSLAPHSLATTHALSWRARDGMRLHGYLTLPPGVEPAGAPLIALLHGGPYSRADGNFDALVQMLANRGYIVFQPNFRGSTGHGLRYVRAAGSDFGNGRVIGDVLDGLDVLLAEGIGSASHQAVMGHSFGGYASLLAVSHRPNRFRVAVASAAPVDFSWVLRWIADNDSSALSADGPPAEVLFPQHGVPMDDRDWQARMQDDAPLNHIADLRSPVFMWAGARDDRVPLTSISRYAADSAHGRRPPVLLIDPEAGHSPQHTLGREALLYLFERAAALHLGGRLEPPSAELTRFVRRNAKLGADVLAGNEPGAPRDRP